MGIFKFLMHFVGHPRPKAVSVSWLSCALRVPRALPLLPDEVRVYMLQVQHEQIT